MPLWGKAKDAYKAALEEVGQKTGNILYHYTQQPNALLNAIPDVAEFSAKRGEHYKPKPSLYTTENINQLPGLVSGGWEYWPGGLGSGKVKAFKELKDAAWMHTAYPEFPFEQAQQKALPGGVVRAVLHPDAKVYSRSDENLVRDHDEWLKRLYDEAGPLTDQTRKVVQESVNNYPQMLQRALKESRVDALKILGPDYQNPKYVSETLVFDPKKIALFWKDKYWKPWAVAGTTAVGASAASADKAEAITPLDIAKKFLKGITGEDLTKTADLVTKAGAKAPMTRREFITGTGKAVKELIAPPLTREEKVSMSSMLSGAHLRDDVWDLAEGMISTDDKYRTIGFDKIFSKREMEYLEKKMMEENFNPGVIKWLALKRLAPHLDQKSWIKGVGNQKQIQWEYAQGWLAKGEVPGLLYHTKQNAKDMYERLLAGREYDDLSEKEIRKLVRQATDEFSDPGIIWKAGKVIGFKPDKLNQALLEQANKLEGVLTDIAGGIKKVGDVQISRRKLLFPFAKGAAALTAGTGLLSSGQEAEAVPFKASAKKMKEIQKAISAERVGNTLFELGSGRFRGEQVGEKLITSGLIEGEDAKLAKMVFTALTPEEIKTSASIIEEELKKTNLRHIWKEQKHWASVAPEQIPASIDGIIKAGHEVKMSRRDFLKLGGMPDLEPLLPELEEIGVDPKYVKAAAGILAAKYLLSPSEAEGTPPKGKAIQELATVMRKWLDDGAPFIREKGKKIRMGDPSYDKMEAIDFIAEEFKGIKTLLNEGKLGTDLEALFSPEGLVKGVEKLAGVEHKVPSPTIHLVQKEASTKRTPKPGAEKGAGPVKSLPIKNEPLTFPDSSTKTILEEGPLRVGGKEVVDIRRGTTGARYIIFDDGTYRSTTKDRLRSLVRDRGAEIYTDIFHSRPEEQKVFQATKSANRRKMKHESDNLSLEQRYLLRDKYVKNVQALRPERNPQEDKIFIEYQGQVMQIPKAYGEYLIKIGAAKAHTRL